MGPFRRKRDVAQPSSREENSGFYVAIGIDPDADDLSADIVFGGDQVALASRECGVWTLTMYDRDLEAAWRVPLREMVETLQRIQARLGR